MKIESKQDDQYVSLMALDQYMREMRRAEWLTDVEEVQLIQCLECAKCDPDNQWLANVAKQACERLVEGYQPTVVGIAKRYVRRCCRLDLLDLVQEGNIALLQAIEDNDLSKGYPLHALVGVYVRNALLKAMGEQEGEVRLEGEIRSAVRKMRRLERELAITFGRDPSSCEIAYAMGINERKLRDLQMFGDRQRTQSLQQFLEDREQDEGKQNFVSLFQSSVEADHVRQAELEQKIQQAIKGLSKKQEHIIRLRYGLDGECYTQVEVANKLGLYYQAIQYAEQRAKRVLSKALASQYAVDREELGA